jgi:DUF971 family protein
MNLQLVILPEGLALKADETVLEFSYAQAEALATGMLKVLCSIKEAKQKAAKNKVVDIGAYKGSHPTAPPAAQGDSA